MTPNLFNRRDLRAIAKMLADEATERGVTSDAFAFKLPDGEYMTIRIQRVNGLPFPVRTTEAAWV